MSTLLPPLHRRALAQKMGATLLVADAAALRLDESIKEEPPSEDAGATERGFGTPDLSGAGGGGVRLHARQRWQ